MEAIQLIQMQHAIECIGLDEEGLLIRIPGPDADEMARVYAYRYEGDYSTYFRWDVSALIRQRIHALGAQAVFHGQEAVKALLATDAPCTEVGTYHTYVVPDTLSPHQFPDVVRVGAVHWRLIEAYHAGMNVTERAVYAVIRDDTIVSTCGSVRENEEAGECYAFTVPEYRRRGYGRQVTAAWGHHLREQGKVAFYSHARENAASQSVARSLGLRLRFIVRTYS
jgi:GNAT superfamily N-acetyltransferase